MANRFKSIIDGNEAAAKYYEYMSKARRDGDKLPTRVHTDPEKRMLVRELNNELDRLQFGYEAKEAAYHENVCSLCGKELADDNKSLVGSVYLKNGGRIDRYRHRRCSSSC